MAALMFPLAFAACSDDDNFNSGNATVGFANTSVSISEGASQVLVPIQVTGDHTGTVRVEVKITETQGVSTEKDVNIIQTSEVIYLPAGTEEADVEFRTSVRTLELDENRSFTLEITSAEGATIENATCQVNINEISVSYEDMLGAWKLRGVDMSSGSSESFDILIEEDVEGETFICSGLLDDPEGKFIMKYDAAGPMIDLGQIAHQGNYGDPVGEALTVLCSTSGNSLVASGTLQGLWESENSAIFNAALIGGIFSLEGQYTQYVMFQWSSFELTK